MIYTGRRLGEILGLQCAWVDLEAGQIRLPKAKTDRPGKRGRGRVIWLNEAAKQVLVGIQHPPDFPHVFVGTKPGQHLKCITRAWKILCNAAGIERTTPFDEEASRSQHES